MNIIQSWWDIKGNKEISQEDLPIVELSRLTLQHNLSTNITFYTDLQTTSNLGYSDVRPLNMTDYPKDVWCLGKLVAMSQQKEPLS